MSDLQQHEPLYYLKTLVDDSLQTGLTATTGTMDFHIRVAYCREANAAYFWEGHRMVRS